MRKYIEKYNSYNDARKRNKESLYNLLIMKQIIKALKDKNDKQIEEKKPAEENKGRKQYAIVTWLGKWIDPLVIITAFLFYATYLLYSEATNQSKITEKAAKAATLAAQQSQEANRIAENMFEANTRIGEGSLQEQKKSVAQEQKNFNTDNKPILTRTKYIVS